MIFPLYLLILPPSLSLLVEPGVKVSSNGKNHSGKSVADNLVDKAEGDVEGVARKDFRGEVNADAKRHDPGTGADIEANNLEIGVDAPGTGREAVIEKVPGTGGDNSGTKTDVDKGADNPKNRNRSRQSKNKRRQFKHKSKRSRNKKR